MPTGYKKVKGIFIKIQITRKNLIVIKEKNNWKYYKQVLQIGTYEDNDELEY